MTAKYSATIATAVERDVEMRVRNVLHSLNGMLRDVEDPGLSTSAQARLEWRAATLRDAIQTLERPTQRGTRKPTRDERDIADGVARALEEEMGWER